MDQLNATITTTGHLRVLHATVEHRISFTGFTVWCELSVLHVIGSFFFFKENAITDQSVYTFFRNYTYIHEVCSKCIETEVFTKTEINNAWQIFFKEVFLTFTNIYTCEFSISRSTSEAPFLIWWYVELSYPVFIFFIFPNLTLEIKF